jgi:hypothetical protein
MSPMPQPRGGKISPPKDIYTALLLLVVGVLLATAAYVTYACYTRYGTVLPPH